MAADRQPSQGEPGRQLGESIRLEALGLGPAGRRLTEATRAYARAALCRPAELVVAVSRYWSRRSWSSARCSASPASTRPERWEARPPASSRVVSSGTARRRHGGRTQRFGEAQQRALVLEPGRARGGERLDQEQVGQRRIGGEEFEAGAQPGRDAVSQVRSSSTAASTAAASRSTPSS